MSSSVFMTFLILATGSEWFLKSGSFCSSERSWLFQNAANFMSRIFFNHLEGFVVGQAVELEKADVGLRVLVVKFLLWVSKCLKCSFVLYSSALKIILTIKKKKTVIFHSITNLEFKVNFNSTLRHHEKETKYLAFFHNNLPFRVHMFSRIILHLVLLKIGIYQDFQALRLSLR